MQGGLLQLGGGGLGTSSAGGLKTGLGGVVLPVLVCLSGFMRPLQVSGSEEEEED